MSEEKVLIIECPKCDMKQKINKPYWYQSDEIICNYCYESIMKENWIVLKEEDEVDVEEMVEHKIWVEWDDLNDETVWRCECGCRFSHETIATNHVKHQNLGYPDDEEVSSNSHVVREINKEDIMYLIENSEELKEKFEEIDKSVEEAKKIDPEILFKKIVR